MFDTWNWTFQDNNNLAKAYPENSFTESNIFEMFESCDQFIHSSIFEIFNTFSKF